MAKGSTVKTKTVAAERPVARTARAGGRTEAPATNAVTVEQPKATVITASAAVSKAPTKALDAHAVARRAYEIFEREGRPNGRDVEHWLRAEAELSSGPAA